MNQPVFAPFDFRQLSTVAFHAMKHGGERNIDLVELF
jgi:hypothetical protein